MLKILFADLRYLIVKIQTVSSLFFIFNPSTIMDSENGRDEVDAIPECSKNSKEIETRIHEWTRCHEKII